MHDAIFSPSSGVSHGRGSERRKDMKSSIYSIVARMRYDLIHSETNISRCLI